MKRSELEALRRSAIRMPPMAKVALDDIANPKTAREKLQREFEKSLRSHESTKQLAARLQRVVKMSAARAKTIAVTESTRAANGQRYSDAVWEYLQEHDKAVRWHKKRPKLPLFMWINPQTADVPREHHIAISGKICPLGETFLPKLHYPGDPKAPLHETINCHCYIRRWRGRKDVDCQKDVAAKR